MTTGIPTTEDISGPTDLLSEAWGVIANAGRGDWGKEHPDWQAAAAAWRDRYHAALAATSTEEPSDE